MAIKSLESTNLFWIFCLLTIITLVNGQNEICHFYGLKADCRYRVDLICLSHITAEINPCADPLEVSFDIKCSSPNVEFSHTFASSDTSVSVPGYQRQVFLQVKLRMKPDSVLNIEADIHVYGQASTDFLNQDVKMAGYNEKCPGLNEAAKIAMGVMGGLAAIAVSLLIVLLYMRHMRRKALQERPALVEYSEEPGQSTPRHSRNFDILESYVSSNNNNVIRHNIESDHMTSTSHLTTQDNTDGRGCESYEDNNHSNGRNTSHIDRQTADHCITNRSDCESNEDNNRLNRRNHHHNDSHMTVHSNTGGRGCESYEDNNQSNGRNHRYMNSTNGKRIESPEITSNFNDAQIGYLNPYSEDTREPGEAIRYSDLINTQNEGPFNITDC